MNHKIRIDEAIALAKYNGKKIKIKELAQKMFPDSTEDSAYVRFNGLRIGRIKKISKYAVKVLCDELNTDPNKLFE